MANGNLERAVHKIKLTDETRREWGGCLTPQRDRGHSGKRRDDEIPMDRRVREAEDGRG